MKSLQKIIKSKDGPVVINYILIDIRNFQAQISAVFPVVADKLNTIEKMVQIASSFRRIKTASLTGVRGQETADTVLVVSRNKTKNRLIHPYRENERIFLTADAIEFSVLGKIVSENRLLMRFQKQDSSYKNKYDSQRFKVSFAKNELEKKVISKLNRQKRLYYSIPSFQAMNEKWIVVKPSLLPIGYTNSMATLPELCKEYHAVAGINGGFFLNMPEELDSIHGVMNDPVGLFMLDGEILIPPTFARGALLINENGDLFIRKVSLDDIEIKLELKGTNIYLVSAKIGRIFTQSKLKKQKKENTFWFLLNPKKLNEFSFENIFLYTRVYGSRTPKDNTRADFVITGNLLVEVNESNPTIIPQNGFVISISKKSNLYKKLMETIERLQAPIKVKYRLNSELFPSNLYGRIVHAIAAGPQLVFSGKPIPADFFDKKPMIEEFKFMEWAPTRFPLTVIDKNSRAPRSAIGITKDKKLLLLTIDDDRQVKLEPNKRYSIGATLGELANVLIDLGCLEGLNLDGGGSTTLYFEGEIINRPADGFPRLISTALLIKQKLV